MYTARRLARSACLRRGVRWRHVLACQKGLQIVQGGKLLIDVDHAVVDVQTAWIDHCDVEVLSKDCESMKQAGVELLVNLKDNCLSLNSISAAQEDKSLVINALIPQIFNLTVKIRRGDVCLRNTLEGDADLRTGGGNITVSKVRGPQIHLETQSGSIVAKELEGDVNLHAGGGGLIEASMLMGQTVEVESCGGDAPAHLQGGVVLGGVYAPDVSIRSSGPIHISSCHGHALVYGTDQSMVRVDGLSGSAVIRGGGEVVVHVDALKSGTDTSICSTGGDVSVSVVEELNTSLTLEYQGDPAILAPTFRGAVYEGFAEGHLGVEDGGVKAGSGNHGEEPDGRPLNRSGSGKIDRRAAKEHSLNSFFATAPAERDAQGGERENAAEESSDPPHLFICADKGAVRVETLSWMDIIKRKYDSQ